MISEDDARKTSCSADKMEDINGVRDRMLAIAVQTDQLDLSRDTILARTEDFVEVLGRISALQNNTKNRISF